MSRKSKGINAERELLKMFWKEGWPCIRSAGSGSMSFPSPDLLVGSITSGSALAIECKTVSSSSVYLKKKEVEELKIFSEKFGAIPFVAVRFDMWYFITLEDLQENDSSYSINLEQVKTKGLLFEELIKFLEE